MGERDVPFDISTVAALHSQLAGVLAGFAFAALLIYLTQNRYPERGDAHGEADRSVVASLLCAMAALVICAVLYSVLAAATPTGGTAGLAATVYGLPGGLSVVALFHSLILIASRHPILDRVVVTGRWMTSVFGPVWIMAYVTAAAATAAALRSPPQTSPVLTRAGLGMTIFLLLATTLVNLWRSAALRRRAGAIWSAEQARRNSRPATLTLVMAITAGVASMVLPNIGPEHQVADGTLIAVLAGTCLVLLLFGVFCALAEFPPPEITAGHY